MHDSDRFLSIVFDVLTWDVPFLVLSVNICYSIYRNVQTTVEKCILLLNKMINGVTSFHLIYAAIYTPVLGNRKCIFFLRSWSCKPITTTEEVKIARRHSDPLLPDTRAAPLVA